MTAADFHVRRRLGLVSAWAVYRLTVAWMIAYPFAHVLASPGFSRFPNGDAVLFVSGGWYLLDGVRAAAGPWFAAARGALVVGIVVGFLGVAPLAIVMVGLNTTGRLHSGGLLTAALERLPTFVLLSGVTLLAQALVLFLGSSALGGLASALQGASTVRTADCIVFAGAALVALAIATIGVLEDLARAASVAGQRRFQDSVLIAAAAFMQSPLSIFSCFALWALGGIAAVAAAAVLTAALHVERAGLWRVGLVFAMHQLAFFILTFCRAGWLAAALHRADAALPPEAREPSA